MSKFVTLDVEGVMQGMIQEGFISDSVQIGTQNVC